MGERGEEEEEVECVEMSPQDDDLRLSGPPSDQGAGGGARTRDIRIPVNLRAGSLCAVPPAPHCERGSADCVAKRCGWLSGRVGVGKESTGKNCYRHHVLGAFRGALVIQWLVSPP
ncbi:hypothetical protein PoB_000904500 [Plakobranchus ocellatus]|uniref:Uncharacterized protein n=1 Tax=Plakobranchus ocellatus TaxID=259542 RepID=A0AAV3YJ62_9GAST|nr:hypothetical protein PoB_000904500 [Plakobranchus ocellatus]